MKLDEIKNILLILSFLALGLNKFVLYVPLFLLFLILDFKNIVNFKNIKNSKSFIIFTFLFFSIVPLIVLGHNTLIHPTKSLIVMSFAFLFGGAIFYLNIKKSKQLLSVYLFGIFAECSIIVSASYPKKGYGYGRLWDPFSETIINSPATSNLLAITATTAYFLIFNSRRKYNIYMSYLIFILSLAFAVYLRGRAFFVILSIGVLITLLLSSTRKQIKHQIVLNTFSAALLSLTYFLNKTFAANFLSLTARFSQGLGSSGRGEILKSGFSLMLTHPFGGFSQDSKTVATQWFHNFWIDSARVAGWIPIMLFILSYTYLLRRCWRSIFTRKHILYKFLISLALITMSQDVIIEGNFRVYLILFLASLPLLHEEVITQRYTK